MSQIRGDTIYDRLWVDSPWWLKLILIVVMIPLCIIAIILLPALWLAEKWGNNG